MQTQNPGPLERLKRVLIRGYGGAGDGAVESSTVSGWAGLQGLGYQSSRDSRDFALTGVSRGKSWKLECGVPTRDFIQGQELLARAPLGISDDVAVLIVNRPLKEMLEARTYNLYTESLQTVLDQSLPLEMRWLAMYQETGWSGLPRAFWERYAVVSDQRAHASDWLTAELAAQLLSWPEPAPDADTPFILLLRRGKAYLRMQYSPADLPTLEHAAVVFTTACDAAVAAFSVPVCQEEKASSRANTTTSCY